MKKLALLLAGVLLLAGCATQGMNLAYEMPKEEPLKLKQVYLEVVDMRQNTGIISPAVKNMKLFSGVGGFVNLATKDDQGHLKDAQVKSAYEEAFRHRFQALGLGLASAPGPDVNGLTIEVEQLWLDLDGSTFKAESAYVAKFSKEGKEFYKERLSGRAEKYNLLGDKTGEETLSQAFSMSVNSLDLSHFKD